jgi:hypothetical protein
MSRFDQQRCHDSRRRFSMAPRFWKIRSWTIRSWTIRSISSNDDDCDDNECRDQRKSAIKSFRSGLCGIVERRHDLRLAAAIRQPASQHLLISLDLTLSQFFRRNRISSSRRCEVQIRLAPAKCAQASCVFGISGSGVSESQAEGLRPGNRSLHSTFGSGGSAKLSVTGRCRRGAVMGPACPPGSLSRCSILTGF